MCFIVFWGVVFWVIFPKMLCFWKETWGGRCFTNEAGYTRSVRERRMIHMLRQKPTPGGSYKRWSFCEEVSMVFSAWPNRRRIDIWRDEGICSRTWLILGPPCFQQKLDQFQTSFEIIWTQGVPKQNSAKLLSNLAWFHRKWLNFSGVDPFHSRNLGFFWVQRGRFVLFLHDFS